MRTRQLAAVLLLFAAALTGCASTAQTNEPAMRPALISHIVFFVLNDPADADALIADCDALLATIPAVRQYACGTHFDMGRDTVRHDYHVGAYIGFASEADLRTYVEHPQHIELVRRWRPRISELRVYDVIDASP